MIRRVLIAVALVVMTTGSIFGQVTTVNYFMNGDSGPDVGRSATVLGSLALSGTNFTNSPAATPIAGTIINVGSGTPNEALSFTGSPAPNSSFSFTVTVPSGIIGWEINNYGFDLRSQPGVSGTASLFVNLGSGFIQIHTSPITAAGNDTWRSVAFLPTSTVVFPGASVDVRFDFSNFTGEYDLDSLFLRGADNFSSVPEPASVALLGITGVGCAVGVWYRRRKAAKLSNVNI